MTDQKALAAAIRGIRQHRGLLQEDFNTIDRSYVGQLERGEVKISVDVLQRIARALKVEAAVLLVISSALAAGNSVRDALRNTDEQLDTLERNGALSLIAEIASSDQSKLTGSRESLASARLEQIHTMRQSGMAMGEIAKALGMSKSTVHKYLQKDR